LILSAAENYFEGRMLLTRLIAVKWIRCGDRCVSLDILMRPLYLCGIGMRLLVSAMRRDDDKNMLLFVALLP